MCQTVVLSSLGECTTCSSARMGSFGLFTSRITLRGSVSVAGVGVDEGRGAGAGGLLSGAPGGFAEFAAPVGGGGISIIGVGSARLQRGISVAFFVWRSSSS